jgi:hypothetical protein
LQGEEDVWDVEEIRALQNKAHDLMEEEELRWKQRAHEDWLAHGDKNSKFFHACVNQKRRTNQLCHEMQQHLCPTVNNIFMPSMR